MQQSQASAQERGAIDAYFDVPLLVGLFPMTRQCLKIRQIAGRARPFIASQPPRGTCSQSYPQKVGIGNFHAKVYFFDTDESPMPDNFGRLAGELLQSEQRQRIKDISLLDGHAHEAYRIFVGGVNAPREYGSSGDRALRMVCRTSLYWEA